MFSCERPEVISLFLQGWFSVFAFFCWVRLIGTVVFQRYYDAVNVVISLFFFMFSIPSPYLYIFSFSVLLICCFLKEWFTLNFNYFSLTFFKSTHFKLRKSKFVLFKNIYIYHFDHLFMTFFVWTENSFVVLTSMRKQQNSLFKML